MRTVSLYITEMSENEIRGALGSFYPLALSGGILLIFIGGAYLNYFLVPLVVLVLPATYFGFVIFLIRDTRKRLSLSNQIFNFTPFSRFTSRTQQTR